MRDSFFDESNSKGGFVCTFDHPNKEYKWWAYQFVAWIFAPMSLSGISDEWGNYLVFPVVAIMLFWFSRMERIARWLAAWETRTATPARGSEPPFPGKPDSPVEPDAPVPVPRPGGPPHRIASEEQALPEADPELLNGVGRMASDEEGLPLGPFR